MSIKTFKLGKEPKCSECINQEKYPKIYWSEVKCSIYERTKASNCINFKPKLTETWIDLELINQCAEMLLIDGHGGLGSKLKLMVNNIIK